MNPELTSEQGEILKNVISNKLFLHAEKYPFKPKEIGYLTHEESIWISAQNNYNEIVIKMIVEIINKYTKK